MPLPNPDQDAVPFTILTAQFYDETIENIEALADGSGLNNGAVGNSQLAIGTPVQAVSTAFSTLATGTTIIPLDNTIPQITEGDQYMTQAITPKSSTNILVIKVVACLATDTASRNMNGAIFQDATANALSAISLISPAANASLIFTLEHSMVAGTSSATTFRFRAGTNDTGTTTFNGRAGAGLFGTATKSVMTVTEYKA